MPFQPRRATRRDPGISASIDHHGRRRRRPAALTEAARRASAPPSRRRWVMLKATFQEPQMLGGRPLEPSGGRHLAAAGVGVVVQGRRHSDLGGRSMYRARIDIVAGPAFGGDLTRHDSPYVGAASVVSRVVRVAAASATGGATAGGMDATGCRDGIRDQWCRVSRRSTTGHATARRRPTRPRLDGGLPRDGTDAAARQPARCRLITRSPSSRSTLRAHSCATIRTRCWRPP